MKHFYLILTLASLVGASVPVSAQISIDEVNAERRNVTFRDRLKSTSVDADYFSLARYKLSLIHISEPTRPYAISRMPSSA